MMKVQGNKQITKKNEKLKITFCSVLVKAANGATVEVDYQPHQTSLNYNKSFKKKRFRARAHQQNNNNRKKSGNNDAGKNKPVLDDDGFAVVPTKNTQKTKSSKNKRQQQPKQQQKQPEPQETSTQPALNHLKPPKKSPTLAHQKQSGKAKSPQLHKNKQSSPALTARVPSRVSTPPLPQALIDAQVEARAMQARVNSLINL